MSKLILAATAAVLALSFSAPVRAAVTTQAGIHADADQMLFERHGKGRVKGGSGCDGRGDVGKPGC
jgi:hypothetical protein